MINLSAPDLTQHPPRSPRVRLGGFAHLPRLLDKARAHLAAKAGEYHYNCPLDRFFFDFTGIDHEALLAEANTGKADSQLSAWIATQCKRSDAEIIQWSDWIAARSPGSADGHEWFRETLHKLSPDRADIRTIFDLLDLDDFVSFGGRG